MARHRKKRLALSSPSALSGDPTSITPSKETAMALASSKTLDNLKAAFAGESQANRRYLFFAEKADKEGFPQVARLFRAIADAETVHARTHLETIGGNVTTKANLEAAISGEFHEFKKMYPEFIEQAKAEGN